MAGSRDDETGDGFELPEANPLESIRFSTWPRWTDPKDSMMETKKATTKPKPSGVKSSSAREGEQIRKLQDELHVLRTAVEHLANGNLSNAREALG